MTEEESTIEEEEAKKVIKKPKRRRMFRNNLTGAIEYSLEESIDGHTEVLGRWRHDPICQYRYGLICGVDKSMCASCRESPF